MDNCYFAVMTDSGDIASTGSGELLISSGCTMLGYLNDQKATSEVLVRHCGKTWVKSGDYGRIDCTGQIFFQGRIKETIVYKGYNIYPSEVESVIRLHPNVVDVCVVGIQISETCTEQIRAYVVTRASVEDELVRAEIYGLCNLHLPFYSHPKEILFLPDLPRTGVGKINRDALENFR